MHEPPSDLMEISLSARFRRVSGSLCRLFFFFFTTLCLLAGRSNTACEIPRCKELRRFFSFFLFIFYYILLIYSVRSFHQIWIKFAQF